MMPTLHHLNIVAAMAVRRCQNVTENDYKRQYRLNHPRSPSVGGSGIYYDRSGFVRFLL